MNSTVARWCTTCEGEREFETPPCTDGHGADCPDLACVHCGAAIVVGVLVADDVVVVAAAAA
jgi:hypothetical protein